MALEKLARLKIVRDIIIGPQNDRDVHKLPIEKHWRIEKGLVKDRCIGITLNVEQPRRTGAPAALSRADGLGELDDQLQKHKEIAEVCVYVSSFYVVCDLKHFF